MNGERGQEKNEAGPESDNIVGRHIVSLAEVEEAWDDSAHALKSTSFELLQHCAIRGCALSKNANRIVLLAVILDGTLTLLDLLYDSLFGLCIVSSEDK